VARLSPQSRHHLFLPLLAHTLQCRQGVTMSLSNSIFFAKLTLFVASPILSFRIPQGLFSGPDCGNVRKRRYGVRLQSASIDS
jgi:hypothetical protein